MTARDRILELNVMLAIDSNLKIRMVLCATCSWKEVCMEVSHSVTVIRPFEGISHVIRNDPMIRCSPWEGDPAGGAA